MYNIHYHVCEIVRLCVHTPEKMVIKMFTEVNLHGEVLCFSFLFVCFPTVLKYFQ